MKVTACCANRNDPLCLRLYLCFLILSYFLKMCQNASKKKLFNFNCFYITDACLLLAPAQVHLLKSIDDCCLCRRCCSSLCLTAMFLTFLVSLQKSSSNYSPYSDGFESISQFLKIGNRFFVTICISVLKQISVGASTSTGIFSHKVPVYILCPMNAFFLLNVKNIDLFVHSFKSGLGNLFNITGCMNGGLLLTGRKNNGFNPKIQLNI